MKKNTSFTQTDQPSELVQWILDEAKKSEGTEYFGPIRMFLEIMKERKGMTKNTSERIREMEEMIRE